MTHPAYPSPRQLSAEAAALARDAADMAAIARSRRAIQAAIDTIENEAEFQHPDIRYHVGDLLGALHDTVSELDANEAAITGKPLVLNWAAE